MLHRGQCDPGTDLDSALNGIDIADDAKPFGRQQHVVVFGNGARHQGGAAALNGDIGSSVPAHPQHFGDLFSRAGPHQRAGPAPIAAGVVDAAAGQHVRVGGDVMRSDRTHQAG